MQGMSDDSKPTITVWPDLLSPPEVWEDFLAGKINLQIGDSNAETQTEDQSRQESCDGGRDESIQSGQAAQRIESGAYSEVAPASDSDRFEDVRPEQGPQEEVVEGQAGGRELLAYKIRVQLNNPAQNWLDLVCQQTWPEWLHALQIYRGIAHDKGFIPLESIAFIVHIDTEGKPGMEMGENVVPFRKT